MGYIVDSTDTWTVEARRESVRIATDHGETEIENTDLIAVIAALYEAAAIQFPHGAMRDMLREITLNAQRRISNDE